MPETIFASCTGLLESALEPSESAELELPESESPEEPILPMDMRLVMSKPWSWICSGYSESVSSSTEAM